MSVQLPHTDDPKDAQSFLNVKFHLYDQGEYYIYIYVCKM